jgi:hypothetical protein
MTDQHCLECMETDQSKIKVLSRRAAVETIYQCKCGFKWMDRTIEEDNKK